jgi:hypothetical protein
MSQPRAHRPGPAGSGQSRAAERPLVMLTRPAGDAAALASAVDCIFSPEILDVVREAATTVERLRDRFGLSEPYRDPLMEFFGPQDLHGNAPGPPSSEHPIRPPRHRHSRRVPSPTRNLPQLVTYTRPGTQPGCGGVVLQFRPRLVEASDQLGEHLDREGERQADIHIVGRRWGPSLRRARPPPLRVYAPLAVQQHAAAR